MKNNAKVLFIILIITMVVFFIIYCVILNNLPQDRVIDGRLIRGYNIEVIKLVNVITFIIYLILGSLLLIVSKFAENEFNGKNNDKGFFIFFFSRIISIGLLGGIALGFIAFLIPDSIIDNFFNNPLTRITLIIIAISAVVIFIEIKLGTIIGKSLSKETGLILGIVLTILGVTLFLGIPIIIYSNKKKENIIFTSEDNIGNSNDVIMNNHYERFFGKNYKDILNENGLSEYIVLFEKHKLKDINIISELTEVDLEKIGINVLGDRKKIIKLFT